MENEVRFECPKCHSDNIQSYELAFQNGIADVNTTSAGIGLGSGGGIGIGTAKTKGIQQSSLSKSVAPPIKKGYILKVFLAFILSPFVGSIFSNGFLSTIISFGVLGGSLYYIYKDVYLWNRNVYPQLIEQWHHSYICFRCGNRFIM